MHKIKTYLTAGLDQLGPVHYAATPTWPQPWANKPKSIRHRSAISAAKRRPRPITLASIETAQWAELMGDE